MTKLIADSGSTKTAWVFLDEQGNEKHHTTAGLNPYYLSEEEIRSIIHNEFAEQAEIKSVDEVYFYGAGCGRQSARDILEKTVSEYFCKAKVYIESDLLGAARACFANESGIVCILGTGSNCCIYDGKSIRDSVPSLGFILGDEGSGGYFGKKILNDYFYRKLPKELGDYLEQKFDLNLESVLEKVYKKPQPNRYVASFATILSKFNEHPYCKNLIKSGFEHFVKTQITYFDELPYKNTGVVGSISNHRELLQDVLHQHRLELVVTIQNPIENLVKYHL